MITGNEQPGKTTEIPAPVKHPETEIPFDPDQPVMPVEDPGLIPDEMPDEIPPIEIPPPGEGP